MFIHKDSNVELPDGWYNFNLLELFSEEKKVFALSINSTDSYSFTIFSPSIIEAFIDGEWTEDFHLLKQEIQKYKQERSDKEDFEKTKKMKNNFGIE